MSIILVVDDHAGMRNMLKEALSKEFTVLVTEDGEKAVGLVKSKSIDIVITDLKMSSISGIEVLKITKEVNPHIEVIIMTAYGTIEKAVEAMKQGAFDFITKPFSIEEIEIKVKKALGNQSIKRENIYFKEILHANYGELIGESKIMKELYSTIEKASKSDATVLIHGESGVGKELVADAIHNQSIRKNGPFIKVNCAALSEGILESELFGHEKGSFTGAISRKLGRFELANSGTLFLDEIGEFSSSLQVKLLRILQEKKFERVGGIDTIKVDVRLISATNKDLDKLTKEGGFRNDLYYRINVIPIFVPSLREHKEDIPSLIEHFLVKICKKTKSSIKKISKDTIELLMMYDWPGNVRELENAIERAIVLSQRDELSVEDFRWILSSSKTLENKKDLTSEIQQFEKESIKNALKKTNWNQSKAAKLLGINRTTLQYKITKYKINENN